MQSIGVAKFIGPMSAISHCRYDSTLPAVGIRQQAHHLRKATLLIATAITAAIGFAVPAGKAVAEPFPPLPVMEDDGTYIVGKDIPPGLYMTLGARGDGMCSWLRLSSIGSDDASGVIDRGASIEAQYALISPTDKAFETHGCQTWSKGSRPATPITPIPRTCTYPLTGCQDPDAGKPSP